MELTPTQAQPAETTVTNSRPFWKRKTLWISLAVLVLVVSGLLYALSTSWTAPGSSTEEWEEVFLYMPRNLELRLSEEWKAASASEITLPKEYSGALFAIKKEGAKCELAYVRMPSTSLDAYKGGEQVFMVNNAYTGDQYIGRLNNGALLTGYPRGFSGGNHNWPAGNDDDINYTNAFVMYSPQTTDHVDEECVKDMEQIMGQLRKHHEPTTLTTVSDGILYIVSERVGEDEIDQVRFIPTGTTTAYSVMGLTATSRPQPQLANNKLYMVVEGELRTVDPFNKTSIAVPNIDLPEGETINSFWIAGNKLIYLAGVNCNSYMAKCDLGLYEYDLITSRAQKLAEHLSYRNIIGYDPNAREVLMTYVFADGGERSENTGIYQYATGQIQKIDSYELVQERFMVSAETYDHIIVREGKLIEPTEPILTREDRWPITYP